MSVIECDSLSKFYGDVRGVEELTFAVEEGEVFGFLGPNGAGKTTTIRALLGFLRPTGGTARLLGADVRDEAAHVEARRRVGYLPSDPGFDPDSSGARFLELQAALKGDDRLAELLDRFDVPVDRRVGALSRGNRQKLAVVAAFMHDPDLVVMDEPTTGLDPLLQERFRAFLREERDAGTTVFFSSHVLSEVRRTCDRVAVIRDGRLAAVESIERLLARGGKTVVVDVAEDATPTDFDLPGVSDVRANGAIRFTFAGDYDDLLAALSRFTVRDLEIREAPLEDVFMRFYGDPDDSGGGDDAADPDDSGSDEGVQTGV